MGRSDTSRATPLAQRDFARILLIKPSSLGDIVHALPVLHGLRQRHPRARISWLVNTAFAPLIAPLSELDAVIEFDRRLYGRMHRDPAAARRFAAFVHRLRAQRFDLVIDLQGLFRSGFLAWASGAPVRIGLSDARELARLFYTHAARVETADVHAADRNYLVAGLLGFAGVPLRFDLAVSAAERQRADNLLQSAGLDPAAHFAAVLPGSRWETKRWLPARFAAVIRSLADERAMPALLLGGTDESELCDAVAAECGAINLAGRTGLRQLVAMLERAAIVVCNDSAPMHLAAALDRPLVCLMGPTNPRRTGPYHPRATVLQTALPCVPCYLRKLSQCRYHHECMHSIQPELVVTAVAAALSQSAENQPGRKHT